MSRESHLAVLEELAKVFADEAEAMLRGGYESRLCGYKVRGMAERLTAAIALMRGQSWQVVGYMDPDADFMLPRDGGCVLSSQLILVRTPTERYSRPVYLPAPPAAKQERDDA